MRSSHDLEAPGRDWQRARFTWEKKTFFGKEWQCLLFLLHLQLGVTKISVDLGGLLRCCVAVDCLLPTKETWHHLMNKPPQRCQHPVLQLCRVLDLCCWNASCMEFTSCLAGYFFQWCTNEGYEWSMASSNLLILASLLVPELIPLTTRVGKQKRLHHVGAFLGRVGLPHWKKYHEWGTTWKLLCEAMLRHWWSFPVRPTEKMQEHSCTDMGSDRNDLWWMTFLLVGSDPDVMRWLCHADDTCRDRNCSMSVVMVLLHLIAI